MAKQDKPAVPPASPRTPSISPTEQTELTGHGPKPAHLRAKPHPVPSTQQSEMAIAGAYPNIGDEVRIDVDRVDYMNRGAIHNAIVNAGQHGKLGRVMGAEVIGGVYMLRIHTDTADIQVPADCVALEAHPIAPVQEGSKAPDVMRKPSTGAYKLT